jgi:Flp pilus assembly pilin Flp
MDRSQKSSEPDSRRTGERGQTLIEYGLIIVLVSLVVILAFGVLVPTPFFELAQKIAGAFST